MPRSENQPSRRQKSAGCGGARLCAVRQPNRVAHVNRVAHAPPWRQRAGIARQGSHLRDVSTCPRCLRVLRRTSTALVLLKSTCTSIRCQVLSLQGFEITRNRETEKNRIQQRASGKRLKNITAEEAVTKCANQRTFWRNVFVHKVNSDHGA